MGAIRQAKTASIVSFGVGALLAVATTSAAAKGPINISAPPDSTVASPLGGGPVQYAAIAGRGRTAVAAIETSGGDLRNLNVLDGNWALPAVTIEGESGGLSADSETLVLIRPDYSFRPKKTRFLVLDTGRLRIREPVTLDGSFSFDAISPDGETMYLVEYNSPSDPLDYRIRSFDIAENRLAREPVVDPDEPEEQMGGYAVARAPSPDGRWTYTLYTGGEETFIHALDTEGATAVCVDLAQFPPNRSFAFDLDVPASGAIRVLRRGRSLATVNPDTFEVSPASAEPAQPAESDGATALPFVAAAGIAAILGLGAVAIRQRRRRSEEAGLGSVFAGAHTGKAERDREPERVP